MIGTITVLILFIFLILYNLGYYRSYYYTSLDEKRVIEQLDTQHKIELENLKEKYKGICAQLVEAMSGSNKIVLANFEGNNGLN